MLLSLKTISSYDVLAKDGKLGKVETFLFDEKDWRIPYVVIDTDRWGDRRKVVVSVQDIDEPSSEKTKQLMIALTKEEIESSPLWDPSNSQYAPLSQLLKFKAHATDKPFGTLDDLLVEEKSYFVRYLVIDTGGWFSRQEALISPSWLSAIDWSNENIKVNHDSETIGQSPTIDSLNLVERDFEEKLFHHYGSEVYWDNTRLY